MHLFLRAAPTDMLGCTGGTVQGGGGLEADAQHQGRGDAAHDRHGLPPVSHPIADFVCLTVIPGLGAANHSTVYSEQQTTPPGSPLHAHSVIGRGLTNSTSTGASQSARLCKLKGNGCPPTEMSTLKCWQCNCGCLPICLHPQAWHRRLTLAGTLPRCTGRAPTLQAWGCRCTSW